MGWSHNQQKLELFNSVALYTMLVFTLPFASFDSEAFVVGWFFIGLIFITVIVNIINLMNLVRKDYRMSKKQKAHHKSQRRLRQIKATQAKIAKIELEQLQ
jgi:uncharacterized membrane protein